MVEQIPVKNKVRGSNPRRGARLIFLADLPKYNRVSSSPIELFHPSRQSSHKRYQPFRVCSLEEQSSIFL